jgi:HSP20 family protein
MATDKVHFSHMFFCPASTRTEHAWQPRADVYRMPDGWMVKLELAGVRPEDVTLSACGPVLLVRGTRRDEQHYHGQGVYSLEIAYSRFERALELPGLSEAAEIATSFRDGMLLIRITTGGAR